MGGGELLRVRSTRVRLHSALPHVSTPSCAWLLQVRTLASIDSALWVLCLDPLAPELPPAASAAGSE